MSSPCLAAALAVLLLAGVGVAAVFAALGGGVENGFSGGAIIDTPNEEKDTSAVTARSSSTRTSTNAILGQTYDGRATVGGSDTYSYSAKDNPDFIPGTGQALKLSVYSQKVRVIHSNFISLA